MSTTPVVTDKPIEITLGDGSVVKGANLEEAFNNLKQMKENTAAELRRQREEAQGIKSQYETLQQEVEKLKNPPRVDDGKSFNKDQYYRMLNDDPIAAQDYLDRYRWDMDPSQVRQQFQNVVQQVSELTQSQVAGVFLAQHAEDFPPDTEAARALSGRVRELSMRGLPFNIDTMNYAYSQLIQEQVIKPVQKQDEPDAQPNPSLSGAGRVPAEEAELRKVENMSDADLEKYMRSKGLIR